MEKEIESLKRQIDKLFELQRINENRIDKLSEVVANNLINYIADVKKEINKLSETIKYK